MNRRSFLAATLLAPAIARADGVTFPAVERGHPLAFPRDFGSHPDYRIEWWYITGWLDAGGSRMGVQVTFFRNRPGVAEDRRSAFAPTQLVFAHAALADPSYGRLRHDQRAARRGFGLADAALQTTDVHVGDWRLVRDGDVYRASIPARDFTLDLAFAPTQPPLLQGDGGYSRKGPDPAQSSYYYSEPHLAVSGRVVVDGRAREVRGDAWLDHEWSSEVMAKDAAGWDWTGLNLDDGAALMAFRMRRRGGGIVWSAGAHRDARGRTTVLAPDDVAFVPRREWRSPRTGIVYPVAFALRAGDIECDLAPLMDDQELDSRLSTGTIYWEGAVRGSIGGRVAGRGYLELTGYGEPLRL